MDPRFRAGGALEDSCVIPAQAGIQEVVLSEVGWIPDFAPAALSGMTRA